MTLNDKIVSLIRTYVPYAIGAAVAWLLTTFALDLSGPTEAAAVAFSVVVVQNVYYLAVRLAEAKAPWVGALLGATSVPEYAAVDNLWASLVRTGIPTIVGAAVTALASGLFLHLDAATQTGAIVGITGAVQAGYYALAVWLEGRFPATRVLLGNISAPAYEPKHSA
jgi:hypothetical protein